MTGVSFSREWYGDVRVDIPVEFECQTIGCKNAQPNPQIQRIAPLAPDQSEISDMAQPLI